MLNQTLRQMNPLGGASAPLDGTLPEFTSMVALAAAIGVGKMGILKGATTGAVAGLVLREAAGANGLWAVDGLDLWQLDGPELDGAFAPFSVNSLGVVSWGTPGAKATGGITTTAGTVVFPGWRFGRGEFRSIEGAFWVDAVPETPAVANCLLAGCLINGSTTTDLYGAGPAMILVTPTWRNAVSLNGSPNTPGLGYGTNSTTDPAGLIPTWLVVAKSGATATHAIGQGSAVRQHPDNSGTQYSLTTSSAVDTTSNDFNQCFTVVGDWTTRLVRIKNTSWRASPW